MLKIKVDNKIYININNNLLIFNGPKGESFLPVLQKNIVIFYFEDDYLIVKSNYKKYLNLYSTLIKQKLKGVLRGYRKTLCIHGIGNKFIINNNDYKSFKLKLGYSHLININLPLDIYLLHSKKNSITFFSNDLIKLTQFIFLIKNYKKFNAYKLKGLLLKEEIVKLKEIKKNKK